MDGSLFARLTAIAVFVTALSVRPANAMILYSNGAVDGTHTAYPISSPYRVADTFTLETTSILQRVDIATWQLPGPPFPFYVHWLIWYVPVPDGLIVQGHAWAAPQFLFTNGFGYDVISGHFSLPNVELGAGTYWLELRDAQNAQGGPVFWDANFGPSFAWQFTLNRIPSETFEISGQVPEPFSIQLLGLALVLVAQHLRRRTLLARVKRRSRETILTGSGTSRSVASGIQLPLSPP